MVNGDICWQRDGGVSVENPLVRSVQFLPPSVKIAMYDAASGDTLRRRTWRGCPLNRAGCELGVTVVTERDAMQSFDMHRQDVRRFLLAWDYLRGTDEQCTNMLLEAISAVGLHAEPMVRKHSRWSWRRRTSPPVAMPVTDAPPLAVSLDAATLAELAAEAEAAVE